MLAYVYKIIFADGSWYYGIRRIKDKSPLKDGYYGSPCTNKSHWNIPHSKIVLREFDDLEVAAHYENQLIRPDLDNPRCLNECANLRFSYEVNKKAREKARETRKGKNLPDQHRLNISRALIGRLVSPEEKERLKSLTRGMTWWSNGEEEILTREPPGDGWIKGRLKDCFGGSSRTKGWKWYHREGELKMFKENPGNGWEPGRKGYNSHGRENG